MSNTKWALIYWQTDKKVSVENLQQSVMPEWQKVGAASKIKSHGGRRYQGKILKIANTFSDTQKKHLVTGGNIQRSDSLLNYNKYMGGVDLSGFLTNTYMYADMRKSLK